MFEQVELENFMGVRRCEKPLKLHKLTILIGPNNAGKTTILAGLLLSPFGFCFGISGMSELSMPILGENVASFMDSFLRRGGRSIVYRYSGECSITCWLEGKKITLKTPNLGVTPEVYLNGERTTLRQEIADYLGWKVEDVNRYSLLIPNSDRFLESLQRRLVRGWEDVERTGTHYRLVRDYVNKVVEERFTEVGLRRDELMVRRELPDGEPYWVKVCHLGGGIERFLTSALWLEAVRPRLVLWDDFEASAHPALVRSSLEWLVNHDWQLVFSTHSADVLYEAAFLNVEDAAVLSLRKLADDMLTYTEYSLDELADMFEKGQDVRKLLTPTGQT